MTSQSLSVSSSSSLLDCLKKLEDSVWKISFVIDKSSKVLGSITDGDIRRHLINSGDIRDPITSVMNHNYLFLIDKPLDDLHNTTVISNAIKLQVSVLPVLSKSKT